MDAELYADFRDQLMVAGLSWSQSNFIIDLSRLILV